MTRVGAALLGVAVFSGCAYYNTLYNSERLLEEGEAHRRAGRDSLAEARYHDVIRKTGEAYRGRRTGPDAAETLLLLGRAHLRVGQPREAHAALEQAVSLAEETGVRSEVLVYLGFAAARLGEEDEALAHLDEALADGLTGPVLGEAYLLRGGLRLQAGRTVEGWDDLDRAARSDPSAVVEAGLESLRWGVRNRDLERARSAVGRLLQTGEAGARGDTVAALLRSAAQQWSPSVAATMLGDVGSAPWNRAARNELSLHRAELLYLAADTAAAEEQAWQVAGGRGESAVDARLLLARWQLGRARDLSDARAVVPILLPVAAATAAAELIDAVDDLEAYSGVGLDEPLGWFAAAEVARNRLGAPILARGLYLAYADTDPDEFWAPKALLGALSVSPDEADRTWLRGRLEAHRNSPYVQAARGRFAAGFEPLEEELQERLRELASR